MPEQSEIASLINDPARLGEHVARVLLRRMRDGEAFEWGRERERPEDRSLRDAGITTTRYYLDVGDSVVTLRVMDITKVTDADLARRLTTIPSYALSIKREGEVIGFYEPPTRPESVVKQLADEVKRTATQRRVEWRREFLQELGA